MMILDRIKYQLGYPEAAKDMIGSKSLLTAVEQYSMGTERILSDYMELIGLDTDTKEISPTNWCQEGIVSLSRLQAVAALAKTEKKRLKKKKIAETSVCCLSSSIVLRLFFVPIAGKATSRV